MTYIQQKIFTNCISLNSTKNTPEAMNELIIEAKAARTKNPHTRSGTKSLSGRSKRRLKQRLDVDVAGSEKKALRRLEAFSNIRNNISLTAMIDSVYKIVDPSLYFSSDDVSILAGQTEKVKVLVTKEAKETLKKHNTGISISEEEKKRRVVTFNNTIAADGELICSVIIFRDRLFTDYPQPVIFPMEPKIFVLLVDYNCDDKIVYEKMYKKCIIPSVMNRRNELISAEEKGLQELLSESELAFEEEECMEQMESNDARISNLSRNNSNDESHDSNNSNDDVDEPNEDTEDEVKIQVYPAEEFDGDFKKFKWIAIAQDGAIPQTKALIKLCNSGSMKRNNILVLKYAGGCSFVQSPNDVGHMHKNLHQLFSSYRFNTTSPDPRVPTWKNLKTILQNKLEKASFDTVWNVMKHASAILSKAFNKISIQSAFRESGIHPFNAELILSANPHFQSLAREDPVAIDKLYESLPEFTEVMQKNGLIPEEEFHRILANISGADNCPPKVRGKPLNAMAVPRQRALIVNVDLLDDELNPNDEEEANNLHSTIVGEVEGVQVGQQTAVDHDTEQPRKKRKTTVLQCGNPSCCNELEEGKFSCCGIKISGKARSKCKLKFCNKIPCEEMLRTHQAVPH
jgi:hypothetical protein